VRNGDESKGKILEYAYGLADIIHAQGLALKNRDFEEVEKLAEEISNIKNKIETEKGAVDSSFVQFKQEYVNILKACEMENAENIRNLEEYMNAVLLEIQELDKQKKVFKNYKPGEASRAYIFDKIV